jgi:aspartyl-tRNA(Asn)/glutamyl-tRNA(Gln) amidotransferase subunit C
MSLTQDHIKKAALLARIKMNEADIPHWQNELSGILKWIDQLQQVPTDGVENYTDLDLQGMPERADEVTDGGYVKDILVNAPEAAHDMFAVPKVIE